jgi:hypothetical protein
MPYEPVSTANRSELTSIIRDIRNRWRLKLAVRGAAFVIGGFLLTLLLSAYALETLKFSPGSIIAFRVAMVMILSALAGYFFVLRNGAASPTNRSRCISRNANPRSRPQS